MALRTETRGKVLVVTMDRPEVHNAIDPEMNRDLIATWRRLKDEEELRVAVLTGAGERAFCAGVDLKRMGDFYASVPADRRRLHWDQEPGIGGLTRNLDPGKPVLAAINGVCLGGGLELAMACDIRIASENATFGLPEVKWAIIPGQGGTQRLPRLVPQGLAMEMILTGTSIDANRAREAGLVNRVLPPAELLPATLAIAGRIAEHSLRAVRHAREAVLRGSEVSLEEGLRLEQMLADPLRDSEENRQARAAFAEKRAR
jgi:enoyl-CoA hydratase/carnithine racemase